MCKSTKTSQAASSQAGSPGVRSSYSLRTYLIPSDILLFEWVCATLKPTQPLPIVLNTPEPALVCAVNPEGQIECVSKNRCLLAAPSWQSVHIYNSRSRFNALVEFGNKENNNHTIDFRTHYWTRVGFSLKDLGVPKAFFEAKDVVWVIMFTPEISSHYGINTEYPHIIDEWNTPISFLVKKTYVHGPDRDIGVNRFYVRDKVTLMDKKENPKVFNSKRSIIAKNAPEFIVQPINVHPTQSSELGY